MPDSSRGESIVLIGMRGSGKSTVGRALAAILGATLVDTDERVEARAGMTIAEVFDAEGEEGFRRRERDVVTQLAMEPPAVVSVGGGAVLDVSNRETLLRLGYLVWLTAVPDVLWYRTQHDVRSEGTRPALTELAGREEIAKLLHAREPIYRKAADLTIDTTHATPEGVARTILEWVQSSAT